MIPHPLKRQADFFVRQKEKALQGRQQHATTRNNTQQHPTTRSGGSGSGRGARRGGGDRGGGDRGGGDRGGRTGRDPVALPAINGQTKANDRR